MLRWCFFTANVLLVLFTEDVVLVFFTVNAVCQYVDFGLFLTFRQNVIRAGPALFSIFLVTRTIQPSFVDLAPKLGVLSLHFVTLLYCMVLHCIALYHVVSYVI